MKSLPSRNEVICLTTVLLMLLTNMGFASRRSDAECVDSPSITAVRSTGSELIWSDVGPHEGATLVIYGPGGVIQERDFGRDAMPEYDFIQGNGAVLQDGNYSWELRLSRGYQEVPDPERLGRQFLLSRGQFEIRSGWPEVQEARECVGHIATAVENTGHPEFAALYDVSGDWTMTGDLGVGTDLPTASVDVRRTDGTAKILVEEASAAVAVRTLFQLRNNGAPRFALKNTGSGIEWSFQQSGPGNFLISKEGTGGPELQVYGSGQVRMGPGGANNFTLSSVGNLTIKGSLTANGVNYPSDRNLKENIRPLDPADTLTRLNALEISRWNYREDKQEVDHAGPMAQDFYELFELGKDDKHLNPADTTGVALAAIQGLHRELKEREAEIESLKGRLEKMEAITAELVQFREMDEDL